MEQIKKTKQLLLEKLETLDEPRQILRAPELRQLYGQIKSIPDSEKASFGQAINSLKQELEAIVEERENQKDDSRAPIDVTAPFDINTKLPALLPTENGTIHPIKAEMKKISNIYGRMGFEVVESREIDDEFHMFSSLNFPEGHPARDDYDTFMTEEGLIAPAHTSTMQNRVLKARKELLQAGQPIAVIAMDRVFRNEDLDARHEHTFVQNEGIFVGENITVGNLVATLKQFFASYFERELDVKITPFYFPFTEPSFEFSMACPFCTEVEYCKVCSSERWIEMLGCGMIHPNVLRLADIDPEKYTGFAWGGGVERLVMVKHGIEDVRYFNSAKLAFLRQFK